MSEDQVLMVDDARLVWRETGEEIVLLDLDGSVYFGLNASAATLWKLLSRGATRGELIDLLVIEHGAGRARAAGDVDEFLAALAREGLLLEPVADVPGTRATFRSHPAGVGS